MKKPEWLKWPVFILLCFIWGSSFILMKASKEGLTGLQIGALRIFSAALVFLPLAFIHLGRIRRNQLGWFFLAGVCGNLLPAFLFAIAVTKIDSSLAGVLNSLTPLCVLVLGAVFFRDRIPAGKWVGVLVGFGGLCLLSLAQKDVDWSNMGYAALVLLATVFYGFNVNLVSHFLKDAPPLPIASISVTMMVIPAALVLWFTGFFDLNFSDSQVQWSLVNACTLGVAGSAIGTALFYWLVQRAGGLFASLVTYGIPFVALFWGFLDGEKITSITVAGLILILIGVYLANSRRMLNR